MNLCDPFLVVHPTDILVHPRVHRAHRLKSADLDQTLSNINDLIIIHEI